MNTKAQEMFGTSRKKPLYIALIVIALVVILVLVYFGTKQFAGQAIAPPATLTQAGTAGILGTETSGDTLSVGIGANIGTAGSVAFEFELVYPNTITPLSPLDTAAFVPDRDWDDPLTTEVNEAFSRITQVNANTIKVEYATLDYRAPLTGAVKLGEVRFSGENLAAVQADDFTLRNVKVWDIPDESTQDPVNLVQTTITPGGESACVVNDNVCGDFCTDNRNTYCDYVNQCIAGASCPTPANVNLDYDTNGNGKVDNDDIFIMKLAFRARDSNLEPTANCGGRGESYCYFQAQGYYICENLEWQLASGGVPSGNCGGNNLLGVRAGEGS